MNEFTAKKLGEVLAFVHTGLQMITKSRPALKAAWGEQNLAEFEKLLIHQKSEIEKIANEVTKTKASLTTKKLRGMMETYIGDEWDNPTELLEWSGFYFGSAIIHWALVEGAAEKLTDNNLRVLAAKSIEDNRNFLKISKVKITALAKNKA